MLYIPDPSLDPYYNQAFEEYVFSTFRTGDILLLWRNFPAVVCGSYQNIFAEADVPLLKERGIAVVRRITGGGTVFHDPGNINYTIISDYDENAGYDRFLGQAVRALNRIGVPAEKGRKSEIVIGGRKISGSAQRVVKGRILHHGTLLYDAALEKLVSHANGERPFFESKAVASDPQPVTNMIEHMDDRSMTPEQFMEGLFGSFGREENIETAELSPEDRKKVNKLADSKYRTWEWTFGKNPPFTYRRSFEMNGIEYKLEYRAVKGVIREISFDPDEAGLCGLLRGRRLDPVEIRKLLKEHTGHEEVYRYLF